MKWQSELPKAKALGLIVFLMATGCGVKGDPVPPDKPVTMGRGRPTYKRATEDIKIEHLGHADGKTKSEPLKDDEDDDKE